MLTEEKNKTNTSHETNCYKLLQTATTVNIHQMHSKQTATINIDQAHQARE